VLPTGIYISTKFENFGWFSKCLIYKFLVWYIWNIWHIFRSEGLFETLTKLFVILQSANRETISASKAAYKKFSGFVQHGSKRALWWAENETGGELRNSEKTELGSRYVFFVSQCIQWLESCIVAEDLESVTDRVCMACNAWFCYLLLCIPCANCAKRKITNSKAANIHNNNAVGCKRNENAVVLVGIGRLNHSISNG